MTIKILLTGTYNSHNKGDAAMQLCAATGLSAQIPDAQIRIASPFPRIDAAFYCPISIVPCSRRRLIKGSLELMSAELWRFIRDATGRSVAFLLRGESIRATQEADLVVDLSGDMLTEDSGVHVAYSHYIPLLRALILDRPFAVCAQSMGPFRWTRPLIRFILSRAAVITIRDSLTMAHLEEIGIEAERVVRVADLAFLLNPAPSSRADKILQDEGVVLTGAPLLGVSLSPLIEARWRRRNPQGRRTEFVDLVAACLSRFAAESDTEILLVPHVTGPSQAKDDRETLRRLERQLTRETKVHVIRGDYRPEELKALIKRCALFVGARMHANIAALSSGVPTVAIAYSHKTSGIMATCGQARFVLPIESLKEADLHATLTDAFERRTEIQTELRERLPALRAEAQRSIDLLTEFLAEHRRTRDEPSLR